MTKSTLDISVVICAYTEDRWDDLVAAVESVQRQSFPPREIIVVVDHNPRLLEQVGQNLPDVIAVENKGQPGASNARNSGVAVTQSTLIAFLDDDAMAEVDWLERLSLGYEDPHVLGVGGAIEPLWISGQPTWFPEEYYWVIGGTYRGMPETVASIRNLWSGNMSIRREIFEALGGFRSDFGKVKLRPRPEDTDICIRALQRWPQCQWLYNPYARVQHKVRDSRAGWQYFLSRCYAEGIGKAELSKLVGMKDGISAELRYTFTVLPRGVIGGIINALLGREPAGIRRAGVIIAGLLVTIAGYMTGAISQWLKQRTKSRQEMRPPEDLAVTTDL